MNIDDIPLFQMLKGRMSYLGERQRVIAENVANSDTPGYQAKDMKPFSFHAAMQGESGGIGGSGQLAMAQTDSGHMALAPMPAMAGMPNANVTKSGDSETTINGNGVVLEDEMMKMTQARMDYEAAVGFYQKALGLIRMASRAPGK